MSEYETETTEPSEQSDEQAREAAVDSFRDAIVTADAYDVPDEPDPEVVAKERREETFTKLEQSAEQLGEHFEHTRSEAQELREELAEREADDALYSAIEDLDRGADAAELARELLTSAPDRVDEFFDAVSVDDQNQGEHLRASLQWAMREAQAHEHAQQQLAAAHAEDARAQEQGRAAHELLSKNLERANPSAREQVMRLMHELAPHYAPQLQAGADVAEVSGEMLRAAAELHRAEQTASFTNRLYADWFLDHHGRPRQDEIPPPAMPRVRETNVRPPSPTAQDDFLRELVADPVRDGFNEMRSSDKGLQELRKAERAKLRGR